MITDNRPVKPLGYYTALSLRYFLSLNLTHALPPAIGMDSRANTWGSRVLPQGWWDSPFFFPKRCFDLLLRGSFLNLEIMGKGKKMFLLANFHEYEKQKDAFLFSLVLEGVCPEVPLASSTWTFVL